MRSLIRLGLLALLLVPAGFLTAADEPAWQAVTADLIEKEKPGYGKLCGVLVDPATGKLYINLSDKGLYVSADQGKTFTRTSMQLVKGRTEWPGCLMIDPTGNPPRSPGVKRVRRNAAATLSEKSAGRSLLSIADPATSPRSLIHSLRTTFPDAASRRKFSSSSGACCSICGRLLSWSVV